MRPLDQVGAVEALDLLHAPQKPRLEVHHLAGVGEVARQFGKGAIDHARPLAEIAFFQRHLVRAGGRLPQRLAAIGIEEARIAPRVFLQHLAIFLDRLLGLVLGGSRKREKKRTARRNDGCFSQVFLRPPSVPALRCRDIVDRASGVKQGRNGSEFVSEYMRFVARKSTPRPIHGIRLPQPANIVANFAAIV